MGSFCMELTRYMDDGTNRTGENSTRPVAQAATVHIGYMKIACIAEGLGLRIRRREDDNVYNILATTDTAVLFFLVLRPNATAEVLTSPHRHHVQ